MTTPNPVPKTGEHHMTITRKLITAASITALCVATPTVVEAMPEPDTVEWWDAYWADELCFAPVNGSFDPGVWLDTFETPADGYTPGAGNTGGHLLPCMPTDCPDGLYLGSGGCMTDDPFAHLPTIDTPAATVDAPAPAPVEMVTLEVGPLIEPAIATHTS